MEPKEWEQEFDEKFGTIKHRGFPQSALKSFISNLLLEQKKRVIEEIREKLTKEEMVDAPGNVTWNACLSQILKSLETQAEALKRLEAL